MEPHLKLSSFQSMGACDGPSLRSVLFLYGCPLRCDYCHNPETWHGDQFSLVSVEEMAKKVLRNKSYFRNGGGVTVSGGEPLLQQEGVNSLFHRLKEQGIHCCLDTSACVAVSDDLLSLTDLFLLDVKFLSGAEYLKHTGLDIFPQVLAFLEQSKEAEKPLWIRHVLYPGLTDRPEYVTKLLNFLSDYPQIQRIDLLPFKNICSSKYQSLGLVFPLGELALTNQQVIAKLKALIPPSLSG